MVTAHNGGPADKIRRYDYSRVADASPLGAGARGVSAAHTVDIRPT